MATRDLISAADRLDPGTAITGITLTVADLERSRRFYETAIGLVTLERPTPDQLRLGPPGGAALLHLRGDSAAPARDPHLTGLFHMAILVPSRGDLARSLINLALTSTPLTGASDHLVSEALYLHDPDGNGIEIYRDRPVQDWPRGESGEPTMASLPLDLDDLLGEGDDGLAPAARPLPADSRIGHVHLQVAELSRVEGFYADLLGFTVTARSYPGALFVAAGDYHHHVGLNTWNSRGAKAPPAGSVGLGHYTLSLATPESLAAALARLSDGGVEPVAVGAGHQVTDPSGNEILITV